MSSNNIELTLQGRLCAAVGASAAASIITNPLEVLKSRLQAQLPELASASQLYSTTNTVGALRVAHAGTYTLSQATACSSPSPTGSSGPSGAMLMRDIIRQEGVTALYRGLPQTLLASIPTVAIYLPMYDMLRDGLQEHIGGFAPLTAGTFSRSCSVLAVAPLELLRTRAMSLSAKDVTRIASSHGGWGSGSGLRASMALASDVQTTTLLSHLRNASQMWRGVNATLLRDVPFTAIFWGMTEPFRSMLLPVVTRDTPVSEIILANSAAAGLSGAVAAAVTTPFDVIKTQQQIAGEARSLFETGRMIVERGSWTALLRGTVLRSVRAVPSCAIVVASYEERLSEVLCDLPEATHAFAYGSGVFSQPGLYPPRYGRQAVLDFFLLVRDSAKWHAENIAANPRHYGGVALLGGTAVRAVARGLGVGVHFNTLVPWRDQVIKYGVIEVDDAVDDLTTWSTLYTAGRLHKPVVHLKTDATIMQAVQSNQRAAVALSLLLLPSRFTRMHLHHTLCGLSYQGDVRMGLAEDGRKVSRIAEGSATQLTRMYNDDFLMRDFAHVRLTSASGSWFHRCWSQSSNIALMRMLPSAVLLRLSRQLGISSGSQELQHSVQGHRPGVGAAGACLSQPSSLPDSFRCRVAHALVNTQQHSDLLRAALRSIVTRSSRRQAVAGFLAAGPWKAATYVSGKLQKGLSSMFQTGR